MWLVLGGLAAARADQCAWIDASQAEAAVRHLRPGTAWAAFCEPCGDARPVPGRVGAAVARPAGSGFTEVAIDGRGVDLAYTYVAVPGQPGLQNLAALAGCPAEGVSRRIAGAGEDPPPDRVAAWLGDYARGRGALALVRLPGGGSSVGLRLAFPAEHDAREARAELEGVVDLDADPPVFATPFAGCTVRVLRRDAGIELQPEAGCGPLGPPLGGLWTRR